MAERVMRDLLHTAIQRRASLLTEQTNAVRLVDGEGDGFSEVFLETYADRWLVSTTHGGFPRSLERSDKSVYWKRLDQHQKEAPSHICGPPVTEPFLIRENGAAFEISFQSGYSQGIFLDQRDNRAEVRRRMKPGLRLLNTFAYTGAFSVAGALGGAETTTLDLSQPYLDWAKRNFTHNGLDPTAHHFCKGDTFHWLRRFAKQGRKFDGIVLDPPTFSRDEKGKVFRVESDYGDLVALALSCLSPDGWLLCCTNCRKLSDAAFEGQILSASPHHLKLRWSSMPADFTGDPYLKTVWVG
jgi:23S rRNA (cytosine1962-C5)-methyltransferase